VKCIIAKGITLAKQMEDAGTVFSGELVHIINISPYASSVKHKR